MSDLERFIIARWMYSIGEPIMSDEEYQLLLESIMCWYPDNEYVHRSWSSDPCPVELLKRWGYADAIRNIVLTDKTESIPSVGDWSTFKGLYAQVDTDLVVSMKHDGWNVQAAYFNGELVNFQTRGRASNAISASMLSNRVPQKIPMLGRYTVCCEATISNTNYAILKKQLNVRSQRGAVSSCLARSEFTNMIDIHAFSIIGDEQVVNPFPLLEEWGFKTVRWVATKGYEGLLDAMHQLDSEYSSYDSPTDGLVVRGLYTRAIRLLSWKEDIYQSYVIGYDESFGLHRIGVKVRIYPVSLKNSTQKLVSVTNYQRVIDNDLRIGSPVAFRFASGAIADLDVEATRLLHQTWAGRYEEFQRKIVDSEIVEESVR